MTKAKEDEGRHRKKGKIHQEVKLATRWTIIPPQHSKGYRKKRK
jgi:hypothetical protein